MCVESTFLLKQPARYHPFRSLRTDALSMSLEKSRGRRGTVNFERSARAFDESAGPPAVRLLAASCGAHVLIRFLTWTACCAGGGSQARGPGRQEARPPGREQTRMEQQCRQRKHAAVPGSTEDAAAFKGACGVLCASVLQSPRPAWCVRGSSIRSSEQTTTFVVSSSTGRISACTCRGATRMSSMRDKTAARTD